MSQTAEARRDLSTFQCYNCQAYGHISKECTNSEGTKRTKDDSTKCYECGEPGHIARDCSSKAGKDRNKGDLSKFQCYQCNLFGHVSKDCKQWKSKTDGGDLSGIQCYKCQQYGHISKECKSETRSMVKGGMDLSSYQCYKCGMLGHVSKDCIGNNMQDLRATFSPKDLRDRLDGQEGMGEEEALLKQYQELKRQVDELKGHVLTPSNGSYMDGDVDFMIMSCAKMLNDDIRGLIESSNRVGYGQGRDLMAIHSRLNSMKPLESVIYQKLDQFLSQFGKTDNTTSQVTILSQHFPKLLAFLGFDYQALKIDCMKYRAANGTVTDSVLRLAKTFNDILSENGGAGKKLWPAVISTTSLAEILIEHFADDRSF